SLIAIAMEWVRVPHEQLVALKACRRRLGSMNFGMTDKNKALLRKFNDARLLSRLLNLPDRLWRERVSDLKTSRHGFIELQNALAIEIELLVPLRMHNLSALQFDKHLIWPNGHDGPAL